jgi:hypothetical protein
MAITDLVAHVDRELERLQRIKVLLLEGEPTRQGSRSRTRTTQTKPKRIISAEARKKIGDAQRARWAKLKKS